MADQTAQNQPAAAPSPATPVTPAAPAAPAPAPAPTSPPVAAPPEAQKQGPENDEKFFAAIGYFAFLFVIPLIVKPKSAFCKFHAKQSMVLFLMTFIVLIVLGSVPAVGSILTLALFAVYVLAIYKSYKGELWSIPIVSKWAGKMDVEALYKKTGVALNTISGLKEGAEGLAQKTTEAVQQLGKQEEGPTKPEEQKQPGQK